MKEDKNNKTPKQEREEIKMYFFILYSRCEDWLASTELTIHILNDDYKQDIVSGKALELACKYGNLEVISFGKNDVLLKAE